MAKAFLYGNGGDSGIDTSKVTATAADILSGKKAYLTDSDEPTAGTLPLVNPTVTEHLQAAGDPMYGASSPDTPTQRYLYARLQNDNARRAYDGVQWVRTPEAKVASVLGVTAAKVVKGNTICGVAGTADTDGGITNFPFTISLTQPTASAVGHVWVKSNRISTPAGVYVRETITADIPNNALILISDVMSKSSMNINGKSSGITTNVYYESNEIHDWVAGALSGKYTYKLPYPRVYTKVNGVIYIENAYVWDGTKWVLVSNADRYFIAGGSGSSPYQKLVGANWIGNSLSPKEMGVGTATQPANATSCSKNGKFIFKGYFTLGTFDVYKREGDTFTVFQTFSVSAFASYFGGYDPTAPSTAAFSSDGTYMALMIGSYSITNSSAKAKVFKFKLNSAGTSFAIIGYTELEYHGSPYSCNIAGSDDLSVIFVGINTGSTYYYYRILGAFTSTQSVARVTNTNYFMNIVVSGNGAYAALVSGNNTYSYAICVDYANKTSYQTTAFYASAYLNDTFMALTNDGEFLGRQIDSQMNVFRIYHCKMSLSGSTVSIRALASIIIPLSDSGTSAYTYAYLTAMSYTGDKNNCYFIATCNTLGASHSSYGKHLILYKAVFSNGAINNIIKLSEVDLAYNAPYFGGIMIGGQ